VHTELARGFAVPDSTSNTLLARSTVRRYSQTEIIQENGFAGVNAVPLAAEKEKLWLGLPR
jgi:hypothetical protein